MRLTHEYTHDIVPRFKYLTWITAAVFLIIIGRLYYLQVIKGPYYHFFSAQNSIKEANVPALRGTIYDRNGVALVENRPAFDAVVVPQYVVDRGRMLQSLSAILGMPESDISDILQKARGFPGYQPVIIKTDISNDEIASIRANKTPWPDETDRFDLRGVDVQMRYAREYKDPLASSHLLGYLKEIDADKLKKFKDAPGYHYKMGDFVGIGGVEEVWNVSLRGTDGFDQKVVNAFGREVTWPGIELLREEPVNGTNLHLTIDARLQEAAKEGLAGKSGAVVALDPRTGEVLALYSSPSLDLNKLSLPEGSNYWQEIVADEKRPLYNRALQGTYPPASTFKITTAAAALGEKQITPETTLFCGGGLSFGGRFYQCWLKGGHGNISLVRALASSCDTFFYQLGLKLGPDKIARYANLLGLGVPTGIDIPGERSGLIPTSTWKEKRFGVPWQAGESLSISVGQGYDTVTPLQNAVMIATIANDGKKVTPHISSRLTDKAGNIVYAWQEKPPEQVLQPEIVKSIKEGLVNVVDSPEGTGFRLKALGLKIAGKTGTAQVISKEAWRSGVEELKDHAWFVGYAPYDDPKIAVAVIVEHGGFGASAAAPVVGKVMEAYLKR